MIDLSSLRPFAKALRKEGKWICHVREYIERAEAIQSLPPAMPRAIADTTDAEAINENTLVEDMWCALFTEVVDSD